MSGGFEGDPHSQDGQPCPRNFLGTTSYQEVQRLESIYVPKRLLELRFKGMSGDFDTAHLRKIHRYLFQDVFPWAGELRVVGLAKVGGAPFAYPQHIANALGELFTKLKAEGHLVGLGRAEFAKRAAFFLGEINAVHAFREGNGRTQREFIRQLAAKAGHKLSWGALTREENTVASVLSHTRGDHSGLATIIEAAIAQTEAPGGKE
jgi:cell filamentation protein